MRPPLYVTGAGMCCAVGFDARAARAAVRAGLSHFEESDFLDGRGERVLVARLPLGDVWGPRRLATMLASALSECVAAAPRFDPASTALLLLVAERGRAGYSDAWARACLDASVSAAGGPLHPSSRVVPLGRAGIGPALVDARALLAAGGGVKRAIVAGADSYLNAHGINHFLRRTRVLSAGSSDGFVPGEGAGALLVELEPPPRPALGVLGVGVADEPATLDNDEPQRARGLTAAAREALSESGHHANDMCFRAADLSGESFYFREAALADTRLLDHRTGRMPLLHLTDCIGETGAAVGPLTLAYLAGAMPAGHTPGHLALAHFASDGGARAALVVAAHTDSRRVLDADERLR